MKSKVTKIPNFLMKGIAVLASTLFILAPIGNAATILSLDNTYLESSFLSKMLYGIIGSTEKAIAEHLETNTTLFILNEVQLRAFSEYVNNGNDCNGKQIILNNNIELNNEEEWIPIGQYYAPFSGIFDGSGYSIKGVTSGLFGYVKSGTIKNVVVKDASISNITESNVGAIVSIIEEGTIEECAVNGIIEGDSNVGGIAGQAINSTIKNSTNSATISGYSHVGGILGNSDKTDVQNSKNEGTINGKEEAINLGGIVGSAINNSTIKQCFNTGNVGNITAGTNIGGIIGNGEKTEVILCINNCEKVLGRHYIGGIAGALNNSSKVEKCINYTEFNNSDYNLPNKLIERNVLIGSDSLDRISKYYIWNEEEGTEGEEYIYNTENYTIGGIAGEIKNSTISQNYYYMSILPQEFGNTTPSDADAEIIKNAQEIAKSNETGIHITIEQLGAYARYVINKIAAWGGTSADNTLKENGAIIIITKGQDYVSIEPEDKGSTVWKYNYMNGTGSRYNGKDVSGWSVTKEEVPSGSKIGITRIDDFEDSYLYNTDNKKVLFKQYVGKDIKNVQIFDKDADTTVTYSISKKSENETEFKALNGGGYLKSGDTIKVTAEFNKYLAKLYGPPAIAEAPTLKLKGKNCDITMTPEIIEDKTGYNIDTPKTTIEYTYKIVEENGNASITSLNLYKNGKVYALGKDYPTNHPEILVAEFSTTTPAIHIDTLAPSVSGIAFVESALETGRYTVGKEIFIQITTNEPIQGMSNAPEIQVNFSNSGAGKYNYTKEPETVGYAKCKDARINGDGTTTWTYSYPIQEFDDGYISVVYKSGEIVDLAGNVTNMVDLEPTEIEGIYADTIAPAIKIIPKDINNSLSNKNVITYEIKVSEEVIGFTDDDIKVNNGTKGALSEPTKNEDGTYSYTIDITTSIEAGNVGNLQVMIEQNACTDLVGYGNVRVESVIRIDKKAPILLNLEAYGTSDIALHKEIDVVKENYKLGETITVIATFDENVTPLKANNLPVLSLQFSQSGNAKGAVNSKLEGNKIIYTYTITEGDEGIVSVKGFTGTMVDGAGNSTQVTKRALDGDTIIADTIVPNLRELKVTTEEGTYKAGKTINVEAIYSENIYALENNEIKNIISTKAPTLKFKFGNGNEREAVAVKYGTKEDGSIDKSKVIYACKIIDGDNGDFSITSYENKENIKVCDIAGNKAILVKKQTGNTVTADTIRPQVTNITARVENPGISNTEIYYKEGNKVKIILTFSEEVSSAVLFPKILVGFSESQTEQPTSYNNYSYESDWNVNSRTIEYTYSIKAGDNGYLWVKVPEGQFKDIAWNTNIEKNATKISNIYADTIAPTITLLKDTEVNQANQTITIKATFNENVYDLNNNTRVSLTKENAPKLIYSFGSGVNKEINASGIDGAIITYTIKKDPVNDNGTLHYELAKGNLCDRAGNEYYQEKTDTTAPELERVYISNNGAHGVYCKKDTNMYITAVFNEEIATQNMKLNVKLGEGQPKELTGKVNEDNKKEVVFTYTVQENDNGKLSIIDVIGNTANDETLEDKTFGYVRDKAGNQKNIFNFDGVRIEGQAIADTINPYVTNIIAKVGEKEIASYQVTEKGIETKTGKTNVDIIEYIITFSETVTGFTKEDVTFANGTIKELQPIVNTDGKQYKLTVYNTFEGVQSIIIPEKVCEDVAGNRNTGARLNGVIIDFTPATVRFISEYNGGTYVLPTNIGKVEIRPNVEISEEILNIEYKWDNGEYAKIENISSASDIAIPTISFTEAGTHTLYIKVIDAAGNITEVNKVYTITNSYITITPSTTNDTKEDIKVVVNFGEGLTDNRKVTFKAQDSEKAIELNASGNSNNGIEYAIAQNGTIYAEATDRVGNKVYTEYSVYNIDKEAPEIEFSYIETDILTNVSVDTTIYTNEDAKISYKWDNGEWQTTSSYVMSVDVNTKFTEAGEHTLYAKAVDECGNETFEYSLTFHVTAIDFEVHGNPENWTSRDVELSVYCDTELSSVKVMKGEQEIAVNKNQTCIITENGDYVFTVTDKNGNTAQKTIKVTKIDKKAPLIASATNVGRVITINSTDAESGIAQYAITTTTEVPVEWSDSNIISTTKDGTYYVWAIDNVGNIARGNSTVTISTKDTENNPDIIFEDLTVIQKNGIKYVKVSPTYTTDKLTAKMDEKALCEKTPEYANLTSEGKLKTGTEVKVEGKTQYVVVVKGDINCDGKVDFLNDIVMINNYRIGRITLKDIQILAGDINNSEEIEFISDIVTMNNYRLGKIKSL